MSKLEVPRLTSNPKVGISSTNRTVYISTDPSPFTRESPPMTKAAQIASAKEPNRSAPIPATSPTLSPTLSAIVAGFFGLSSGSPAYTFPTKSDPKSAAFVKIPPPTLAKRATLDPPKPKPATVSKR